MSETRPPIVPAAQSQGNRLAPNPGGVPRPMPAIPITQLPRPAVTNQPPKVAPIPAQPVPVLEEDAIGLVDEVAPAPVPTESKIKAFGLNVTTKTQQWKRQPHASGTGAVRVRTFHGKLSDQGMEYLDNAVNEWLDQHPEVEVKFVTSNVGVFEGKIREPALVLNLWY